MQLPYLHMTCPTHPHHRPVFVLTSCRSAPPGNSCLSVSMCVCVRVCLSVSEARLDIKEGNCKRKYKGMLRKKWGKRENWMGLMKRGRLPSRSLISTSSSSTLSLTAASPLTVNKAATTSCHDVAGVPIKHIDSLKDHNTNIY